MYQNALLSAQATISQAWEVNTIQRRDRTMHELSQWLSQLSTQWEKSLMTCTPAALIAFLQDHWLEAHAGTTLPDDSLISSSSGVNQCLSIMSTGTTKQLQKAVQVGCTSACYFCECCIAVPHCQGE